MSRFPRFSIAVLVALLAAFTLTGCSTIRNIFGGGDDGRAIEEFRAADKQYKDDSVSYAAARAVLRAEWKAGRLKRDDWNEFRIFENAVAGATPAVERDFEEWVSARKKPRDFDIHSTVLRNAQAEVITLAKDLQ